MAVTGGGGSVFITVSGSWSVSANQKANVTVTLTISSGSADASLIGEALYSYLKNNYSGFTIRLMSGGTVIDQFNATISQPSSSEIQFSGTSKVFNSATSWGTIEVVLGNSA